MREVPGGHMCWMRGKIKKPPFIPREQAPYGKTMFLGHRWLSRILSRCVLDLTAEVSVTWRIGLHELLKSTFECLAIDSLNKEELGELQATCQKYN